MAQTLDPLWLTETPRPCGCVLVLSRAGQGIRECSTHAAAPEMAALLRRFAEFAEKFDAKPIRNLDDTLYAIHTGTEWAAALRLSDCRAARALLAKIDGAEA